MIGFGRRGGAEVFSSVAQRLRYCMRCTTCHQPLRNVDVVSRLCIFEYPGTMRRPFRPINVWPTPDCLDTYSTREEGGMDRRHGHPHHRPPRAATFQRLCKVLWGLPRPVPQVDELTIKSCHRVERGKLEDDLQATAERRLPPPLLHSLFPCQS